MHETSQLLLSNWESTALEMCVFSYRVNKWLRLNATIQIMTHPPLVVADVLCKSNTATTTEKVDIGGVVWKWTQVHPTSLILQTQTMVEISWALPEMIWQSHLHTIWQTPSECHTNKNDACQIPSEEPANSCQCPSKVARPKFNAVWVFMTCYRKALPVGFYILQTVLITQPLLHICQTVCTQITTIKSTVDIKILWKHKSKSYSLFRIFCKISQDYAALIVHHKISVTQSLLSFISLSEYKSWLYSLIGISVHPVNISNYDTASSGYHYIL